MKSILRFLILCTLFCLHAASPSADAWAGASASQWVVVVNGDSHNSRTLANHYCQLRDIPGRNVIVLKEIPNSNTMPIDEFRSRILGPVLKEIEDRQLSTHIQGIAYSCDIPTTIELQSDLSSVENLPKVLTPTASINGLTYLFRWVMEKNPTYITPDSNWYATHEAASLLKIYQASPEAVADLKGWIENRENEKAATWFDELRSGPMSSYPIDYLAAQQWALAGDKSKAISRLSDAIRKGWRYRGEILKDPSFDDLREDKEFQKAISKCPNDEFKILPSKGFDARNFFAPNCTESLNPKHGVSYLLSVVLSYTGNNRLTLDEAISHLERSTLADFTRPTGTFYFSKTTNVRSTTRQPNFDVAIEDLRKHRFKAEVIETPLPPSGSSVAGITFGVSDFDWDRSRAKLMPGSLADNLTSFGGAMTINDQTKCTELLRYGAAASCGTVAEPYALQFKFPLPFLHAHYAKGLTAAESFYGAVQSPYQLLILGDPLCQPYAIPPRFKVSGLKNRDVVAKRCELELLPSEEENSTDPVQMSWLIDGKLQAQSLFVNKFNIDIDPSERGAHEWRFVAKGPKPIETRWERSLWVLGGPKETHLELIASKRWSTKQGPRLKVRIESELTDMQLGVRHNWELLDLRLVKDPNSNPDGGVEFEIDLKQLGSGPVQLQPVALNADGVIEYSGIPVTVFIQD